MTIPLGRLIFPATLGKMDFAISGTPGVSGLHCLFGGYGEEENRTFSVEPVKQGSK